MNTGAKLVVSLVGVAIALVAGVIGAAIGQYLD